MRKIAVFIVMTLILFSFAPIAEAYASGNELERAVVSQVCYSDFEVTLPGYAPYNMPAFKQKVQLVYRVYYVYSTGEITEVRYNFMNPIIPVEHPAGYGLLSGAVVSQGSITNVSYSLSSDKRTIYFNLSGQCYVRYYESLQLYLGEQQMWQNCSLTGSMTPSLS